MAGPNTNTLEFTTFGSLLKYLRRRVRMTQSELGQRCGYSTPHISRLENNLRMPDHATVLAVFVPALGLQDEPALIEQMLRLSAHGQPETGQTHRLRGSQTFQPQPTPFIGRSEELARIAKQMNDPACRLLTLVGPGGIGKTRLALEAAGLFFVDHAKGIWAQTTAFTRDGIYFVPLQSLITADSILSSIADAIGYKFYSGSDPRRQLIDYVRSRNILFILDNFEHLLDGKAIVSEILANAPGIKIIVTSREPLNLQEEWLYRISGMGFPQGDSTGNLMRYSAVQLFAERARRINSDFSLETDHKSVLRICELVDGMPLALEMTAAWLKRLPCQEIAAQLERGIDILEAPLDNLIERHHSIRAVFDWSWMLLSESERDVFRKLSVFQGGFRKEAAEAITGATLYILSALVDKSLLRIDGSGRYDLHELVRQYAEQQRNALPETSQKVCEMHAEYYLTFLLERTSAVQIGQSEIVREVDAEFENVKIAWNWAVDCQKIRWIRDAIKCFYFLYDYHCMYQEAEEIFGRTAKKLRGEADTILATILALQGWCHYWLAHYEKAKPLFEESLAIARQRGDLELATTPLMRLSETAIQLGDYETAWQLGHEAYEIMAVRDESNRAMYLTFPLANLGRIMGLAGDYSKAKDLLEQAIAYGKKSDIPSGLIDARNYLGEVELALEEYTAANLIFWENRAYQKNVNYGWGMVRTLIGLGEAATGLCNYKDARRHFSEALKVALTFHQIPSIYVALVGIAGLLAHDQDHEQALQLLSIVLNYPATAYEIRMRAQRLFSELESQTPAQSVARAVDRATSYQISEIVEILLTGVLAVKADSAISHQVKADQVTERELDILRLLAEGQSNQQIADQLFLTVGTVKWYVGNLLHKLDATNRTQAVARARQLDIFG